MSDYKERMSLGLYFHLPFCAVHCTYCPFAISTDLALQDAYTEALVREIEGAARQRRTGGRCAAVDTIYLGGGTPSRTSLENLTRIFAAHPRRASTSRRTPRSRWRRIPRTSTPEAVAAWRALGVNRISIGVQSFHDDELTRDRAHSRPRSARSRPCARSSPAARARISI